MIHFASSSSKSNGSDELAVYLTKHNFDKLYVPLRGEVELEDLWHLKLEEVDAFADEIGLKQDQKLLFKDLMDIIMEDKQRIKIASSTPDDEITIVVVGDMGSGKTSLMKKYCNDEFDQKTASSEIVDNYKKIQPLPDNTNIQMNIWYIVLFFAYLYRC